jgi:hypothetical protein
VGVGVGIGVAGGFDIDMTTPLFQTSFLPLLMQVNLFPLAVAELPAFLQESPALTAALAFKGKANKLKARRTVSAFFMVEG